MERKGLIFDIVRGSIHDGTGIRTVVYFKGCPLHCAWCHNPEGISDRQEILFAKSRCIGCGRCLAVCPEHHTTQGYLRQGCTVCGRCAEGCPGEALSVCGRWWTVQELVSEIMKDRAYYGRTGGGVTFSGGECFLQPVFLEELASCCRRLGIQTAAETSLYCGSESLRLAVEWIDELFVDLKHMDGAQHKRYTGGDNAVILRNMKALSWHHQNMTVRIPLIPGVNDSRENLEASARFLDSCGPGIRALELLKFNELARDKYGMLGREGDAFPASAQGDGEMEEKRAAIRRMLDGRIRVK